MKVVIFSKFGEKPILDTVDDPILTDDGVIIQVKANGICRSDWHGWMGHDPAITDLPHVLGHELAGVIESVGKDVSSWKKGDRVTVPFSGGCGHCPQCKDGFLNVCDNNFQPGFTAWGAFAELVAVKYAEWNLVRLPDDMAFVEAATLGCRFATAFRGVMDQGGVSEGNWVVVHGCGGVGLSAIMIASALGAKVVAVDITDAKLEFARAAGAQKSVNSTDTESPVEEIHEITGGGAHLSIDAIGNSRVSRNSINCLRKRGRHVQIGLTVGKDSVVGVPMDKVIARELEIVGSHGIQAFRYKDMLKWILEKKIDLKSLVTRTVSLEESIDVLIGMVNFENLGVTVIDRF
jgi:alcohol dehydrogenase